MPLLTEERAIDASKPSPAACHFVSLSRARRKSSNQPPCPQSSRDRFRIFVGHATPAAELAYELSSRRQESSHRRSPANKISEEEI
jgi:hypothetical protein